MPDDIIYHKLREMAEHRGLKLVKSRKRNPGTGDFGKFGLVQADGEPLLGVSQAGLTASAEDIETYLRKGSLNTWKASAQSVPARAAPVEKPIRLENADDDVESSPVKRPRQRIAPAKNAIAREAASKGRKGKTSAAPEPDDTQVRRPSTRHKLAPPEAKPISPVATEPLHTPLPGHQLRVRAAKPTDAPELAKLLGQLTHGEIDGPGVARKLEAVRKLKGGMVIAELGMLVGCCAWALLPTLQYGLIGRITMILVHKSHRRQGIATAMFKAAAASLGNAGCTRVEALSDIEIRNTHNFFRALDLEQTSYRFAGVLDGNS